MKYMKYFLNKEQFSKVSKTLKKQTFKYWNLQGNIDDLKSPMKLFGIPYSFSDEVFKWAVEWYGEDKIQKKIDEVSNKIFKGIDGSYDFNFYIEKGDIDIKEEEIYFDAVVEGSGKVRVVWHGETLYDNVFEAANSEEIGWEIRGEIKDIIGEKINEILELPFNISIDHLEIIPKEQKLKL